MTVNVALLHGGRIGIGRTDPHFFATLTWAEANVLQAQIRALLIANGVTMRDAIEPWSDSAAES